MGLVGGLAVGQPVLHGFTFEGLIESAAGLYRSFFYGVDGSLFAKAVAVISDHQGFPCPIKPGDAPNKKNNMTHHGNRRIFGNLAKSR